MSKVLPVKGTSGSIVDDDVFEMLAKHKWCLSNGYPSRRFEGKLVYLHRIVLGTPPGCHTDHINGNKLDNRLENLRICDASHNCANHGKNKNNTTGFKGVYELKGKFRCTIMVNRKQRTFGPFDTPEAAHQKYLSLARAAWKEFARS